MAIFRRILSLGRGPPKDVHRQTIPLFKSMSALA
jgi:hypothetical protein